MIEVVTVIKACFNLFQQGGLVVEYRKIQRWLAIASDNKQEHGSKQLMARGWNWMIFQVPSNTNHSTILWCSPTLTHPPFSYPHAPALEARDVSCCMPVSSVGHRKHLGLWEYLYMWIAPIVFGMSREECHKRQVNRHSTAPESLS